MLYFDYDYTSDFKNNEFWSICVDLESLEVTVSFWPSDKMDVDYDQQDRIYDLPDGVVRISAQGAYVYIQLESDEVYQFKFEDNGCLIGDVISYEEGMPIDEGEHIRPFGMHDFYND